MRSLVDALWDCLGEIADDLAGSVANVMSLLGNLLARPDLALAGRQLSALVPRLYPFFRHTLSSVRQAVVAAVSILLDTGDASWIDERLVRLLFQNLVVEPTTASAAAFERAVDLLAQSGRLEAVAGPHLCTWLQILVTPLGTPVDAGKLLLRVGPQGAYDVDKAILGQDPSIADEAATLRGRIAGVFGMAQVAARLTGAATLQSLIDLALDGRMPMERQVVAMLICETAVARSAGSSVGFEASFGPKLLGILAADTATPPETGPEARVLAAVAGAAVALRAIPSKLNPLIRAIMNSVKVRC